MSLRSSRTFLIAGFVVSLLSVFLNSVALSRVNARLKEADLEYNKLVESIASQRSQVEHSDLSFGFYEVMRTMTTVVPPDSRDATRNRLGIYLAQTIIDTYAAANDISPAEVLKAQNEDLNVEGSYMDSIATIKRRLLELMNNNNKGAVQTEIDRLELEYQRVVRERPPPTSELAKNLREIRDFAEAAAAQKDGMEYDLKLYSRIKPLIEQWRVTNERKENRKRELDGARSSLALRASTVTYGAIVLQIFGLMLILTKDLTLKTGGA